MRSSVPVRKTALLLGLVGGLLACAAGVALATALLPEWRAGDPPDAAFFRERYRQLAARAGFVAVSGEPRISLTTGTRRSYEVFHATGADAAPQPAGRTAIHVEAIQDVRGPRGWPDGNLGVQFSFGGEPRWLSWWHRGVNPFVLPRPDEAIRRAERLAPLLLRAGESLGPRNLDYFAGTPRLLFPIAGSSPPQHLLAITQPMTAGRQRGKLTGETAAEVAAAMSRMFVRVFASTLGFVLLLGLFVVLALKARLSVVNGALLALVALVTLNPAPTSFSGSAVFSALTAVTLAAWVFLLWSAAESLLRSTDASFTTSLDALRTGRLGPRGGKSLLLGFGFGAALAGLRLALAGLAETVPGLHAAGPSVDLPVFSALGSPVADGARLAGGVGLALALAFRLFPIRWAPVAAALAAGALFSPVAVEPWGAGLAGGVLVAGLLTWVAHRHGLTALLTASLVSALLPAAILAALHLAWLPGTFAATALPCAAILLLGWLGLSRSAVREVQHLSSPAFVRRLEEERRLKHEMSLLARMQRGLLPRTLPKVEGYEIAARSLIATEAGGDLYDVLRDEEGYLWLAAGDVAGHGYSCAIAQAMTKAALASLAGRGRAPSEVLQRMDRVLRAAGAKRNFTSLALLRLHPGTGEAVLSNAAYPFPLLAAGGEVQELAFSGLPLGQGPERSYEDYAFRLPAGGALVFCSDGLFEAADSEEAFYGDERARKILRLAAGRDAGSILEALMADWNHHLRGVQPLDDTTVVVLKRTAEGGR
ncbi:MAG TPA: SpoIIE family protein phosphatase [Thermoanaerobaculia bacterium]